MSIRKREHVKSVLGRLNTRGGKVGAIAILFVLMATATAAVFSMDYVSGTATTQSSDIHLQAGADCITDGSTPSQYPAATAMISSTGDYATIGVSMFPSVSQASPAHQPATYFTDLVRVVNNPDGAIHTIQQVTVSDVHASSNDALGQISVYYWTSNPSQDVGSPLDISSAAGHYDITPTTTGGNLLSHGEQIAAGGVHYIGVVAYAGSGAADLDTVSFSVSIQWQ